jgi:hypothetical protein
MQTKLNVQSHLSKSLLSVFLMLQGVLIPEFGDLILRVCLQMKTEQ